MSHRRRRRRAGGDGWKILAGSALIVLSLGFVGAYGYLRWSVSDRPELSADTLCPTAGPRGATIVLLDASDDLPEITREQVRMHLTDLSETLAPYTLLELRLLDPSVSGGRIVFSKCHPGDGSNLNELVGNPTLAHRRWLRDFRAPLDRALEGSLAPAPSDTSPIMATVQRIAIDRFTGRAAAKVPKALVIVSDMLEHTADYSHYRGNLSYDQFRLLHAHRKLRTDLNGADVIIRYVQRLHPAGLDTVKQMEFWQQWTRDNNGGSFQAEKLQGAG